jgi:hypothetical protein
MKHKKAQEEMVGFVLIMIVVAVIILVFIGISIRPTIQKETTSTDINQFLESSIVFTTSCATSFEPAYSNLGELINDCHQGRLCTSQKTACQVLNETIHPILDVSWQVGIDRPLKGYEFLSEYKTNSTQETIIQITKGNCTGNFRTGEAFTSFFPGTIVTSLKVCT